MQRSSVVLPDPLGPRIDTFSPRATSRSTPPRTSSSPKRLWRSTMRSRGRWPAAPGSSAVMATGSKRARHPVRSRALAPSEAMIGSGRLVIGVPVNLDAGILFGRNEPCLVGQTVFGHRLDVQAFLPDVLDGGVHRLGELRLV